MTIVQILEEINRVKPCKTAQLYRYFNELGITPIGARQRPQQYPPDSANRILIHLGYLAEENPKDILSVKQAKKLAGKAGAR